MLNKPTVDAVCGTKSTLPSCNKAPPLYLPAPVAIEACDTHEKLGNSELGNASLGSNTPTHPAAAGASTTLPSPTVTAPTNRPDQSVVLFTNLKVGSVAEARATKEATSRSQCRLPFICPTEIRHGIPPEFDPKPSPRGVERVRGHAVGGFRCFGGRTRTGVRVRE